MEFPRSQTEASFARYLLPLARWWRAEADRTLAALGLSHASGWVLLHVGRLGDGVRQSDLAAAVDMRGASLVPLIDALQADGLIVRRVEATDRRINRIDLTDAGRAQVTRIEAALRVARAELLGDIDDRALGIATDVLERLAGTLAERRGQRR